MSKWTETWQLPGQRELRRLRSCRDLFFLCQTSGVHTLTRSHWHARAHTQTETCTGTEIASDLIFHLIWSVRTRSTGRKEGWREEVGRVHLYDQGRTRGHRGISFVQRPGGAPSVSAESWWLLLCQSEESFNGQKEKAELHNRGGAVTGSRPRGRKEEGKAEEGEDLY